MSRSTSHRCLVHIVLLVTALLAGPVHAQLSSVSVEYTSSGPVGLAELRFLLGNDVQFQIFDFEADEAFCLLFGYTHEVNGQLSSRNSPEYGFCNLAGRQRLVVMMRVSGDQRVFSFSLNDRDSGMGGASELAKLPVGDDISGFATFLPAESIHANRDTTLFRWRLGPNPPSPYPHHDVSILVRLRENQRGLIGTLAAKP